MPLFDINAVDGHLRCVEQFPHGLFVSRPSGRSTASRLASSKVWLVNERLFTGLAACASTLAQLDLIDHPLDLSPSGLDRAGLEDLQAVKVEVCVVVIRAVVVFVPFARGALGTAHHLNVAEISELHSGHLILEQPHAVVDALVLDPPPGNCRDHWRSPEMIAQCCSPTC